MSSVSSRPVKRVRRSVSGAMETRLRMHCSSNTFPNKTRSIVSTGNVLGNPQASLDMLPDELVLLICMCISGDGHGKIFPTQALASLCLVNKRLNRIGTECLYKRLVYNHSKNCAMAQTLIHNQQLAKHVLEVEILMKLDTLSPRDIEQQYARVLLTTTNLHTLTIRDCSNFDKWRKDSTIRWPWLDAFPYTTRAAPKSSLNVFLHLKKLRIEVKHGLMAGDVRFAFRLPSLQELSLAGLFGPDKIDDWDIPESSCTIRVLRLRSCFLDSAVVVQMLSSIEALQRFDYQYTSRHWQPLGPADDPRTHWAENIWDEIGRGLLRHKDSLSTIRLHEQISCFIQDLVYPHGRDAGTLGSLGNFRRLTTVQAPLEALISSPHGCSLAQKLPAGLERLILTIGIVRKKNCHVYRQALMSLKEGIFTRPPKFVRVNLYSEIPVVWLSFFCAFDILTQAGIYACVYNERDGQLQLLKPAGAVKEMEEDGYARKRRRT